MKSALNLIKVGCCLVVLASHVSRAEIYKAVAPDGRTMYTDDVNKALAISQNPQQITVLDKLTVTPPMSQQPSQPANVVKPTQPTTPSVAMNNTLPLIPSTITTSQRGDYRLTIITPVPDSAYRRVVQPLDVAVSTSPSLKVGDRLVYLVNGKHVMTTQDDKIRIPTDNYPPEQYTLTVKIENITGEIIATAERPFYILSNNFARQNQRKAAAEAKAAYHKLPWYKKIKINKN